MIPKPITYSALSTAEMFALYNQHAAAIGRPPLAKKPRDRMKMVAALAILKTYRAPPVAIRKGASAEVRDVVIEELSKLAYYECVTLTESDGDGGQRPLRVSLDDKPKFKHRLLQSVGFSYAVVLGRIKARLPKSKVSGASLRVHQANARQNKKGYEAAKLPDKRPHSSKKET